jgi:hypothetical protein
MSTLVAAAVLALALVVPGWLSALIIGGGCFSSPVAALVGRKQIKRATPRSPKGLSTESRGRGVRPSASLGAPLLGVSGEKG